MLSRPLHLSKRIDTKRRWIVIVICLGMSLFFAGSTVFLFHALDRANERYVKATSDALYWNATITDEILLTPKELFLKHSSRYYLIMGWHSPKPARSGATLKQRQKAGFTKWQKTQISIKAYKYELLINVPRYTLVVLGFIESCFKALCKHLGDEEGWLGIAREAVGQTYIFYAEMKRQRPDLAKKLRWRYRGDKDLHDPLNSLTMATVRLWGLMQRYGGNLQWVISTYHWGLTRMWYLWTGKKKFKDKWYYYPKGTDMSKATIKDASSVRSPLQYYFFWSEIQQAWAAGRKDINKETINYMKRYLKNSSKEKRQWIHSWRYVQRLKRALKTTIRRQKDLEEHIKRASKLVSETEAAYYRIYKGRKKTKWGKSKGIFWRLVMKFKRMKRMGKKFYKKHLKKH